MSKKNRKRFNQSGQQLSHTPTASNDLAGEYRIIKFDLIRVLVMNAIFLAGVLALYYTNRSSGYLERWFQALMHL